MRKNSFYTKFDWFDIFTEPIKFHVYGQGLPTEYSWQSCYKVNRSCIKIEKKDYIALIINETRWVFVMSKLRKEVVYYQYYNLFRIVPNRIVI